MDLYKNFTAHRYWCILSKYTVIFPRWPEFIVDFNVFVIATYPELYENYIFSRIPELDSSENDRQGPEIFFFIFLIFSAVLQQKIPIICTQIDNNYMFDMPGRQLPAPPRNTQTEATSLCAWLCRSRLLCATSEFCT